MHDVICFVLIMSQISSWAFAFLIIVDAEDMDEFRTKEYFCCAAIPFGFLVLYYKMGKTILRYAIDEFNELD